MSDMAFDVSTFNFDDLVDVVTFDNAEAARNAKRNTLEPTRKLSEELGADGGIPADAMDLINYSGIDISDDEEDYNGDVSDLLAEQKNKNIVDAANLFGDLEDETPINFGDGFELSKAQLKELFKAKGKVEHDAGYFAEQAERFSRDNEIINQRALMQQTVLEQNINVLQNRLNNPNLPDHEYASTAKQLQVAQASLMQLSNEINAVMQKRAEQEQLINGYRIRTADQAMSSEFPQWNNHKEQILNYIVNDNGIPVSSLEKVYDKGLMKIALKAYLYDQNRSRVAEQVKNPAVNARSTVGAKSSTRNATSTEAEKIKAEKALARLGSSRQANLDAFKYLK